MWRSQFSRSVVCEVSLARKVEHPGETVKALTRRAYGCVLVVVADEMAGLLLVRRVR